MRANGELVFKVCMFLLGQDVLQEKEHHIEQLLKERETSHAENVESKLKLKQEFEQYRSDYEDKLLKLASQLDDEKKKLEDAVFRFEEELISKGDLEVSNKNNLDKLKKLDDELEFEKSKSLKLERNLEDLRAQHLERQKRSIGHEEEINSLKEQLERAKRHISENDVAQNDLSKSCQEKDVVIERLRSDLNTANKLLKEKCIAQESQVLNELQRTKSEVVEVKLENEKISQEKTDLEGEVSQLKKNLEQTKSESNCSETDNEKSYQKQIEELRQQVKESKQQMYDFKKESAKVIVEKDKKIHESEMILSYEKAETERLKGELNQTINELMQNGKLNENRHKRQVEQRQVEISDLYDRFVVSCDQLTTCRILSTQLENEICVKNEMIEKLQLGYSSYSRVIQEQKAYISRIMMQVKAAEMRAAEWQNKFNMAQQTILELEGIKQQLEKEILALGANDHDTELILQDLQNARTLLENLRIETREKLEAAARVEQELRFNLESMTKQFAYEREELLEKLRRANETEGAALDACQKSRDESLAHQEQLQLQIAELTKIIESNKIEYSKEIDFAHEKVHELQMLLEKITAEKEKLEHDFNFKYERLTNEIMNLNEVIKEKSELLMIAEEKLHQHLMESNSISGKDKAEFERKINELMMEINNYQRIVQESNINLEKTQIELNECKTSTFQLEQKIHTQEYKIAELLETNNKCETMYAQTKDMLQRTEMQIQELNLQLKSINDMKTKVENMLSNKNNEIENLNQEINNLQSIRTESNANILEKEQRINTLVAEIEKLQTQKNAMDSVLVERENKIIALIDQLDLLKGQTTDKEIIEKQEKQLIDLKMELQRVTQEKIEVNNALVVKDNQIAELKHNLDEKSTYIERVIQEKETEVSLCRQQLSALDEQKNEALNTLHEKEERLISLTNEMHELQTTKMIIENQLRDHQHNFENLKEQLRLNGNCKEANDAIIKELEIKLAEKEETITILQNDIQNLQAEWQHPTNNPIVSEIMKNLEEKEKLLMEKESQIIILNNEIKQAIAQTQHIQQSWQLSVQQLENQVHQLEHERETSLGKCEGLQKEIVVLTQKLHEASTWEQQLNIQKQKFAEIYVQLTTSEGERNELMNKLQVALTQVPLQHCEPITQVIREIQEKPPLVIKDLKEDITHQQIELYQQMHEIKIMLTQKENELLEQRNECSRLQEQLLKAETRVVEVPIPVPGPVQYIETCTQTEGSVQNVPTIPDYKVELEQIQTQLQQTTVQLAEKTQQLILKENECATLQQVPVQKEIVKVPVEVPGPIQYIEKCTQVSKEEKPVNQEEVNSLYVQLQQVTIQLTQKEQELMTQKNECEQLQKKVVEKEIVQVPVPVPGPVQYVEKCTNTDFAPEQPTQVHITQEQFNTVYTQLQETASQLVEKEEQLILKQNECNTLQQHIHEKEIVKVPVPVPGPVQVIEKCVGTEETPIPQETVQEITNLHIQLHEANVQLIEQQQQLVLKQNECQNLQEKLIHHKEVVEVPVEVPVPGPVQIVERCTEGVLADTAGKVKDYIVHVMLQQPIIPNKPDMIPLLDNIRKITIPTPVIAAPQNQPTNTPITQIIQQTNDYPENVQQDVQNIPHIYDILTPKRPEYATQKPFRQPLINNIEMPNIEMPQRVIQTPNHISIPTPEQPAMPIISQVYTQPKLIRLPQFNGNGVTMEISPEIIETPNYVPIPTPGAPMQESPAYMPQKPFTQPSVIINKVPTVDIPPNIIQTPSHASIPTPEQPNIPIPESPGYIVQNPSFAVNEMQFVEQPQQIIQTPSHIPIFTPEQPNIPMQESSGYMIPRPLQPSVIVNEIPRKITQTPMHVPTLMPNADMPQPQRPFRQPLIINEIHQNSIPSMHVQTLTPQQPQIPLYIPLESKKPIPIMHGSYETIYQPATQNNPFVFKQECQADMQQLLEEHSLAVGQVDFLNSIIIDMKRKNEELQARIEILESGHHNGATHQGHDHCHNVIIKKIAAPRKYCDICEIFDAHETEDCPVQMSDADIHQVIKVMDHRNVRPYCEICEVFGHATEDCTMNETY